MFTCGPDCCLGDVEELAGGCGGKKFTEGGATGAAGPGEKEGGPMSMKPETGFARVSWRAMMPVWVWLGMKNVGAGAATLRLPLWVDTEKGKINMHHVFA